MLFKAGGLGSYDPQIIKPPEGYEGADKMNFAEAERRLEAQKKTDEPESHTVSQTMSRTSAVPDVAVDHA